MEDEIQRYIDAIPPEHRPLFDRIQRLILTAHPEATVALSYKMPTYRVGRRRLYLGAWQHGVSIYGWQKDHDGGFGERHPALRTGKGTIQLRPSDAEDISDDELLGLVGAALDA